MAVNCAVRTNTGAAEGVCRIGVVCVLQFQVKSLEAHFLSILLWTLHLVDLLETFSVVCQNIWDASEPFTKNASKLKMINC